MTIMIGSFFRKPGIRRQKLARGLALEFNLDKDWHGHALDHKLLKLLQKY